MICLILAPEGRQIMHISDELGYQENGNYLINNGTLAVPPPHMRTGRGGGRTGRRLPEKWCYTELGGFVPNPDWIEPEPESDSGATWVLDQLEGIDSGEDGADA